MIKLLVKDIVGPHCGTYDDGVKLYRVTYSLLVNGNQVNLDFEGIRVTSSSFFSAAIGNLLQEFTNNDLELPVTFSNLTSRDKFVLDRTLKAERSQEKKPTAL